MSQIIELPDLWLLIAPCGCIDGYMRAVSLGRDPFLTAESAWRQFEPRKRFAQTVVRSVTPKGDMIIGIAVNVKGEGITEHVFVSIPRGVEEQHLVAVVH